MFLKQYIYILALAIGSVFSTGLKTHAKAGKTDRILFLLDASADMAKPWMAGTSKYALAASVINSIADSIYGRNADIEFGLRVFGHQYPESQRKCSDNRIEVRFTKDNTGQLALRLNDLKPKGRASSAIALAEALKLDIIDTARYRYSLVLLQNAGAVCDDDNCTALMNSGQKDNLYRIYKLQLDTAAGFVDQYCMDNTFILRSEQGSRQAVNHIGAQYARVVKTKQDNEVKPKPASPRAVIVPQPVKKPERVDAVVQTAPVVDTVVPARPEAVVIKKGSRISAKEPVTDGTVNLANIRRVGQMKIYEVKGDKETEVANIFPVGLDWKSIKLPIGHYKVFYVYGYSGELMKTFDVVVDGVTEIMFP